jgi:tetratricopeptide (TPR) repeat protein
MKKSFLQELRDRNVWREVRAYLFGGAAIIPLFLLLQPIVGFPQNVSNIIFIIFFSLFPSVFLFAYHHGESREAPWSKAERIGIPANILVTLFLVIFFYNNNVTASETTTKLVENLATGELVEKKVVKPEFRKKLMITYFKNKSGDTSLNWLEHGFPYGIDIDLEQDIYISTYQMFTWNLERLGVKYGDNIPMATYLQEARKSGYKNVLIGNFTKINNKFKISFSIWDSRKGRKISEEKEVISEDIFEIIDQITMSVKSLLLDNKEYVEEAIDFTTSSQLTESFMAYKYFMLSKEYDLIFNSEKTDNNTSQEKVNLLNKAIEIDPHFAWAYYHSIHHYSSLNHKDSTELRWKETMKRLGQLTTARQYQVKARWYAYYKEMPNKAIKIYQDWGSFSPDNIDPFLQLGSLYETDGNYKKALEQYNQVFRIDPNYKHIHNYFAAIYSKMGNIEKVIEYKRKNMNQYPKELWNIYSLARTFDDVREIDSAMYYFQKIIDKDPYSKSGFYSLEFKTKYTLSQTMDLTKRKDIIYSEYEFATDKQDSSSIGWKIAGEQYWQGKINRYDEMTDSLRDLRDKRTDIWGSKEYQNLYDSTKNYGTYINRNNEKKMLQIIKKITKEFYISNPDKIPEERKKSEDYPEYSDFTKGLIADRYYDIMSAIYLDENYHKERFKEDIAYFLEYASTHEETTQAVSYKNFTPYRILSQTFALNNEYDSAITLLEKHKTDISKDSYIKQLARYYQKNKEYAKAEENFKLILKVSPFSPKTNYSIALLYYDWGKKEKAKEHLNIALEIWKNADKNYFWANKAKETAQEWGIIDIL